MIKGIFVNLTVKDLGKARTFWEGLGFSFYEEFCNDSAVCLVFGEGTYAMLLVEKFFKSFIPGKELVDASKNTDVITAFSFESREEIDDLMNKVSSLGGREFREASDHGWMYARTFEDLDGHIWEFFFMNMDKMPKEEGKLEVDSLGEDDEGGVK